MSRKLLILYGSETGTAQDFAEQVWRESKRFYFNGPVLPMDSYDVRNLVDESLVIFVCSTTGQGDEPDNMRSFWRFLLRKKLPSDSLQGVKFAVMGFGDSGYVKYNFAAKKLHKRLLQLGGMALMAVGLCDDQHDLGPSATYMPWLEQLWEKILAIQPLPEGQNPLEESPRQFRWNVEPIDEDKENNSSVRKETDNIYATSQSLLNSQNPTVRLVLEENRRITHEEHFQDVRFISFKMINPIAWQPGDVLVLRPCNGEDRVRQLFGLFQEHNLPLHPETVIEIREVDFEMPVPDCLRAPISLRSLATQYWDLNAIPRPRAFALLAKNCLNDLERERLLEFSSPAGQEDLFSYANRPRRTIVEVLQDFPHATSRLTLEILMEVFQPIKPRSFSIASCSEVGRLQLLVAVVEYRSILATPRQGLCSTWLKNLPIGTKIVGWLKKGTLKLPADASKPLVMVGPGTGLAPFRSVLLQKEVKLARELTAMSVLFFGCRNRQGDFHCEEELKRMEGVGLLKLITAFSRDQEEKIYVQHRIKESGELLRNLLINQQGYFFVAGSSKNMPQSVKEALSEVIGEDNVQQMLTSGRYQEETWS
ncbi:NADPH-dependent diflavin oxidoreductase 1 [Phlebotomus argentipes]|uniref:NADPH-dependent diflavin oxidoreductase 1 n=1 Tax=Phlebotomus argentipes TaxID=94469 RepID=UPI002892C5EE|nr:NADPH-dependent diflavin oxidoreductase 1 [Phlebotomus argentipes]